MPCTTVYCLKFIYVKVFTGCSTELNERLSRIYKLIERVFNDIKCGSIYSQEIKKAIFIWIYAMQHTRFSDIFIAIQKHQRNCLQQQFELKLDDVGILHRYGWFVNAIIDEDTKYPKLLPRHEHFTTSLISEVHQCLIHTEVAHTLSQIIEEYWIPQEVKSVIRI